ncbi:MAG TPA: hypothetical protein ENN34_01455 [Deltaproteobacteria bacterium]|nr:hypothetical protein [Deltaproteobacteria bacterium]
MTQNTVCGTIKEIRDVEVEVTVNRTAACEGCRTANICHAFTRTNMDFNLPRPEMALSVGDRVVIALESSSFLKSCAYAFLIPLASLLITLAAAKAFGAEVSVQAVLAVAAFCLSLVVVRKLGTTVKRPTIIEVLREE